MMDDARFEDAPFADRPLRLRAETGEDLEVLSSLVQDAVGRVADVAWLPRKRRLVVLLNRFRWEDAESARQRRRPFERVRAALTVDFVLRVQARGIRPEHRETVFSVLSLVFEPNEGCSGRIVATLAGGAEVAAEVECLDATLTDLSRPWQSISPNAPHHGD